MGKHAELIHEIIISLLETGAGDLDSTGAGYADPGYTDPSKLILFGNWNPKSFGDYDQTTHRRIEGTGKDSVLSKLARIIDKAGLNDNEYTLEWSDEWSTCQDCNKAVRTQPDSYSWKPRFVILNDCELFCVDCAKNDMDALEEHFKNNENIADTFGFDWEDRGWTQLEHVFESGWHPGQNDDPKTIAKNIDADHDFLFVIQSTRQFDTSFVVYVRPKNYVIE